MDPRSKMWLRDMQRMSEEKSGVSTDGIGGAPVAAGDGRVVDWGTPEGWEAFKRTTGFYPFGWQNGTIVMPGNAAEAPVWAKALMGGHATPVERMR
jgi:hypothetical protein